MNNMSLSEKVTYSTVRIICQYKNGTSGSGTGFIMNLCFDAKNSEYVPVLITNNHVVENSIKTFFQFCVADDDGKPIDTQVIQIECDGNGWIPHPNKEVDLCCLCLSDILIDLVKKNLKVFYMALTTSLIPKAEEIVNFSAMEDVFMIGYPNGLSDMHNNKPIIRKGITSSHLQKDYNGKKETLLDIASYPGSSGSPVFILNQGTYSSQGDIVFGDRIRLLGVLYAGPIFNAQGILQFTHLPNMPVPVMGIPMNLGVMIKAERILEFESLVVRKNEVADNGK